MVGLGGIFVLRLSDQEFVPSWGIRAGCSFSFLAFKMEENIFTFAQRALKSSHGEYSVTSSWSLVCNLFANKPMQDPGVKMLRNGQISWDPASTLDMPFPFPSPVQNINLNQEVARCEL